MLIIPTVVAAFYIIPTLGAPVQHVRRMFTLGPGQWAQLSAPVQDAIKSIFIGTGEANTKATISALETITSAAKNSDSPAERLYSALALRNWETDINALITRSDTPQNVVADSIQEMETWTKLKLTYNFNSNTPASEILKAQPVKGPTIVTPQGSPQILPNTPQSGVVRFGSSRMKPGIAGKQEIGTYLNQLSGQNKQAISDAIDKLGLDKVGLGGVRKSSRDTITDEDGQLLETTATEEYDEVYNSLDELD